MNNEDIEDFYKSYNSLGRHILDELSFTDYIKTIILGNIEEKLLDIEHNIKQIGEVYIKNECKNN